MSVDLSTKGSIVLKSSGVGVGSMTISAPLLAANRSIVLNDPAFDCALAYNKRPVTSVVVDAAGTTLTEAQSGNIIALNLTAGGAGGSLVFPAPTVGMNYLIVVAVAGARVCTITGPFRGYVINDVTRLVCAPKASIATSNTSLVGDTLEIYCPVDGVWCVRGFGAAAASFA